MDVCICRNHHLTPNVKVKNVGDIDSKSGEMIEDVHTRNGFGIFMVTPLQRASEKVTTKTIVRELWIPKSRRTGGAAIVHNGDGIWIHFWENGQRRDLHFSDKILGNKSGCRTL